MIIFLISFAAGLILTSLVMYSGDISDYFIDRKLRQAREKRELQEATRKAIAPAMTDTEKRIMELESELFGEGKEINSLPGYTWSVRHVATEDAFNIVLKSETGHRAGSTAVKQYEGVNQSFSRQSYVQRRPLSEAEVEKKLQDAMKKLVADEILRLRKKEFIKEITDKYDGKSVVQD